MRVAKGQWANMCRKTNQVQSRLSKFRKDTGSLARPTGTTTPSQSFERTQGHSQDRQGQPSQSFNSTQEYSQDRQGLNPDGDSQDICTSASSFRQKINEVDAESMQGENTDVEFHTIQITINSVEPVKEAYASLKYHMPRS